MTRSGILILLLILAGRTPFFSQSFGSHKITPLNKDYKIKDFNEEAYRNELESKYKFKIANDGSRANFLDILIENKKSCLNLPTYDNWIEGAEYVSKIAHKVLPESYFANGRKVSILRSSEINAFCFEDGSIYITIALLSLLSDEAELAAILAHEYGHLLNDDACRQFKAQIDYNNDLIMAAVWQPQNQSGYKKIVPEEELSKELMRHETEADLMAVTLFNECSYTLNSAISVQTKFKTLEDFSKKSKDYRSPNGRYIRTHPPATERIDLLKKQVGQMKSSANKRFLIDSLLFNKIKQQSTDELIYLSFCNKEFYQCLYDSYKELIKEPKDDFYAFFVTESLRRLLATNKPLETRCFITSEFRTAEKSLLDDFFPDQKKEKPKYINSAAKSQFEQSIFYNYTGTYPFNPELANIKNRYTLNDTIEFVTYKEAFTHFYKTYNQTCKPCKYSYFLADSINEFGKDVFNKENEAEALLNADITGSISYGPSGSNSKKTPIFLNDVSVTEGSVQTNQLIVSVSNFIREMFEEKLSSQGSSFDQFFYQKLNFRNNYSLRNNLDFLENCYDKVRLRNGNKYYKKGDINKFTISYSFKKLCPDQLNIGSELGFNKLVWVNIYSYTKVKVVTRSKPYGKFPGVTMPYHALEEKTTYYAFVHCMDLENGSISSLSTKGYSKVETDEIYKNKITLGDFKANNYTIFESLFNDILKVSEKLIKN